MIGQFSISRFSSIYTIENDQISICEAKFGHNYINGGHQGSHLYILLITYINIIIESTAAKIVWTSTKLIFLTFLLLSAQFGSNNRYTKFCYNIQNFE